MKNKYTIVKNPNEEDYLDITEAVKNNDGYCPCLNYKNDDTKCMCESFRESQEAEYCHCGRFYKFRNYESIVLIANISDTEGAESFFGWFKALTNQGFNVLPVLFDSHDYHTFSVNFIEMAKSKIAMSDAVFIKDEEKDSKELIEELRNWAEDIGKKVLDRGDLLR